MAWQQLREPNLDPYIIQPNGHGGTYTLTDWLGWCLAYVQTAFGTGWGGNTAWDCWQNHTVNKHEDWSLPSGVFVPIFFSGAGGDGHACIYKDGQVWSAPITHKPYADVWPSINAVEQHYGVQYVGWAEGIGGTRVAQLEEAPAPPPPAPPYTISAMPPKLVHVQANHYKWNLAQPTFQDVVNNPITTSGGGLDFTAVATLTRSDAGFQGYTYYLDDANTPHGWNVLDCQDIAPTLPMPAPYVPPAAPVKATLAETYTLVTTLQYYGNLEDARNDKNAVSTIKQGKYYIWDKGGISGNFYCLSATNTKNDNMWINTLDNIAPPPTAKLDPPKMDEPVSTPNPTPVPDTIDPATMNWHGTLDLRYAGMYVFWNHNKEHDPNATNVEIIDLEQGTPLLKNGKPLTPANGQYAQFSGKVKWTDGNWYGRLKDTSGQFKWYACKIEDLWPYNDIYGTKTTVQERQVLHTLTPTDRLELWIARFKTIGTNIFDIVKPKK
jgi:hypothetical protein